MTDLVVEITAGDIRYGVWCERCALPSRVEVDMLWIRPSGVTLLATAGACGDCGGMS